MCGIAGIVVHRSKEQKDALDKMVGALKHRGPDAQTTAFFEDCALGHARLSIIDLISGDQPIYNTAKSRAVILNGEIYGYKEIKKTIDYAYKTTSDTELILALYEKYRKEMLQRLPGMFVFAIWDNEEKELFCARDRFGEKPFYYTLTSDGKFIFASELKAILASNLIKPTIRERSLSTYLTKGYVHPSTSIFENVCTLAPAHALSFKNGKIKVWRYWNPPAVQSDLSLSNATEEFRFLFEQAVSRQLIADVNVGAFLSGGLDSSNVVIAATKENKKLHTYSFGFNESLNELPYAREVASQCNTIHRELFESEINLPELMLRMAEIYDEPFADSSHIPTYLISKLARKYEKVVLTGDGGDELLGGYSDWYRPFVNIKYNQNFYNLKLKLIFLAPSALAETFVRKTAGKFVPTSRAIRDNYLLVKRVLNTGGIQQAHANRPTFFNKDILNMLGLDASIDYSDISHRFMTNTVNDALVEDLETYMAGDILVKTDRAAMANSLELRAPFLDVDFAEFCLKLPSTLKISSTSDKIILREAYSKQLPPKIRTRAKQGFGAPINTWLKDPSMKGLINEYIYNKSNKMYNYLPSKTVFELLNRHEEYLWKFLTFSLWCENYLK